MSCGLVRYVAYVPNVDKDLATRRFEIFKSLTCVRQKRLDWNATNPPPFDSFRGWWFRVC